MQKVAEQQAEELEVKAQQAQELDGVTVEVVGTWLWIGGDTKPHKDKLKDLGFWWSHKRKKWYWHPGTWKGFSSDKSYQAIKNKYGAATIKAPEEDENE